MNIYIRIITEITVDTQKFEIVTLEIYKKKPVCDCTEYVKSKIVTWRNIWRILLLFRTKLVSSIGNTDPRTQINRIPWMLWMVRQNTERITTEDVLRGDEKRSVFSSEKTNWGATCYMTSLTNIHRKYLIGSGTRCTRHRRN